MLHLFFMGWDQGRPKLIIIVRDGKMTGPKKKKLCSEHGRFFLVLVVARERLYYGRGAQISPEIGRSGRGGGLRGGLYLAFSDASDGSRKRP